ncbi:MAG: rod shape-determining protein MreD [Candidatus Krumholzibacteriia bacterium]
MRHFIRTTVAWIVLAFVGEALIAPVITIRGVGPDFTVIAVVILAMAEGARAGALGGFALGLVQDLAVPTLLGLHAFCKSLMGWVLGRTRGRLVYGMPLVELSLLVAASLSHDTVFLMVQSRQQSEAFLGPWLREALPTAVYTALVGWPLIRLADLLGILRRED